MKNPPDDLKPALLAVQKIWPGAEIRKARVADRCSNSPCRAKIEIGDYYIDLGDTIPEAGGFATEHVCLKCRGGEVS